MIDEREEGKRSVSFETCQLPPLIPRAVRPRRLRHEFPKLLREMALVREAELSGDVRDRHVGKHQRAV